MRTAAILNCISICACAKAERDISPTNGDIPHTRQNQRKFLLWQGAHTPTHKKYHIITSGDYAQFSPR